MAQHLSWCFQYSYVTFTHTRTLLFPSIPYWKCHFVTPLPDLGKKSTESPSCAMSLLGWALPGLSAALWAYDSHTLNDWPGDELDLCQVGISSRLGIGLKPWEFECRRSMSIHWKSDENLVYTTSIPWFTGKISGFNHHFAVNWHRLGAKSQHLAEFPSLVLSSCSMVTQIPYIL